MVIVNLDQIASIEETDMDKMASRYRMYMSFQRTSPGVSARSPGGSLGLSLVETLPNRRNDEKQTQINQNTPSPSPKTKAHSTRPFESAQNEIIFTCTPSRQSLALFVQPRSSQSRSSGRLRDSLPELLESFFTRPLRDPWRSPLETFETAVLTAVDITDTEIGIDGATTITDSTGPRS